MRLCYPCYTKCSTIKLFGAGPRKEEKEEEEESGEGKRREERQVHGKFMTAQTCRGQSTGPITSLLS